MNAWILESLFFMHHQHIQFQRTQNTFAFCIMPTITKTSHSMMHKHQIRQLWSPFIRTCCILLWLVQLTTYLLKIKCGKFLDALFQQTYGWSFCCSLLVSLAQCLSRIDCVLYFMKQQKVRPFTWSSYSCFMFRLCSCFNIQQRIHWFHRYGCRLFIICSVYLLLYK